MAGPIMTSNHPRFLWPGVKGIWGRTYDDHQTEYTDLFDIETSDKAYEEFVQITGFGLAPVKAQGADAVYDSEVQGPISRFVHLAYALGYIVTHEEIQDNLYLEVSKTRASSNARAFRQTKERVAANIYNRAFSSSAAYYGADGGLTCIFTSFVALSAVTKIARSDIELSYCLFSQSRYGRWTRRK